MTLQCIGNKYSILPSDTESKAASLEGLDQSKSLSQSQVLEFQSLYMDCSLGNEDWKLNAACLKFCIFTF